MIPGDFEFRGEVPIITLKRKAFGFNFKGLPSSKLMGI